jgi:hypothetical protein
MESSRSGLASPWSLPWSAAAQRLHTRPRLHQQCRPCPAVPTPSPLHALLPPRRVVPPVSGPLPPPVEGAAVRGSGWGSRRRPNREQGGNGAAPAMSEWREEDDDGARCLGPRRRPRTLHRRSPLPRPSPAPAAQALTGARERSLAGARWTTPSPVTAGSAPRRRALDAPLAGARWMGTSPAPGGLATAVGVRWQSLEWASNNSTSPRFGYVP